VPRDVLIHKEKALKRQKKNQPDGFKSGLKPQAEDNKDLFMRKRKKFRWALPISSSGGGSRHEGKRDPPAGVV